MTSETQQSVRVTKRPVNWNVRIPTWGAIVCVAAGIAVALPPFLRLCHEKGDKFSLTNLSSLGSYWQGSAASLFSLGAFLLIYATFLAQQKQVAHQDKELEDQKQQFQLQHDSIKLQNFENSFYQLLNLQSQIASQMRQARGRTQYTNQLEWYEGRTCFSIWFDYLNQVFHRNVSLQTQEKGVAETGKPDFVKQAYLEFYKTHQEDLGHYFRTLYHLIKFVKVSNVVVEYEDKRRYTSLVRAQLSAYELLLLFYDGITEYGEKFKPLIEEFGLLEHLDKTLLLDPSYEKFYAESAYK